jgi:Kef-type K+ transport system membrane component KefB
MIKQIYNKNGFTQKNKSFIFFGLTNKSCYLELPYNTIVLVLFVFFVLSFLIKNYKLAFLEFSGTKYIALGIIIHISDPPMSQELLAQAEPFLWFGIGMIGFHYGLNFKITDFGKVNPFGYKIALFDISITFLIIFASFYLILTYLFQQNALSSENLLFISIISAIGVVSSLSATSYVQDKNLAFGKISDFALNSVQFQQTIALILFGIFFLIFPKSEKEHIFALKSSTWTFVNLFLPIILGFLYQIILSTNERINYTKFILLGIIVVNTGIATIFKFSPILFNLLVGIILGNTSRSSDILKEEIKRVYHSVFALILIFVGYKLQLDAPISMFILTFIFIISRYLGKIFGQKFAYQLISPDQRLSHNLAWLFLSQGRIAIILAISFNQFYETAWNSIILVISVLSVMVYEFIGIRTYKNLLVDLEEIEPESISK